MRLTRFVILGCAGVAIGGQALARDFVSRDQAQAFIAAALPKATTVNPAYRTIADGTVSQWRTESVAFSTGPGGAVTVTMRESFSQTKAGKTTNGRHEASLSLADVEITEFSEPADVTPSGEASTGILFACKTKGCVAAQWGDKAAPADKTDISIQDKATREALLAAFRRLQSA